jgi:hypothetical protein
MVANFIALNAVGPRVRNTPVVEVDSLRIGWNNSVWRLSRVLNQNRVHPAVGPIAEIAAWACAEQSVFWPVAKSSVMKDCSFQVPSCGPAQVCRCCPTASMLPRKNTQDITATERFIHSPSD